MLDNSQIGRQSIRYTWNRQGKFIATISAKISLYDKMQEFLLESERSRICCKCWSWAGDGTWVLLLREFRCCGGGRDCRRRRCSAGLRLYFSLAWMRSSLNTWEIFRFSFADTSTKPFSHFMVTNSLVLSVSTCNLFSSHYNINLLYRSISILFNFLICMQFLLLYTL